MNKDLLLDNRRGDGYQERARACEPDSEQEKSHQVLGEVQKMRICHWTREEALGSRIRVGMRTCQWTKEEALGTRREAENEELSPDT